MCNGFSIERQPPFHGGWLPSLRYGPRSMRSRDMDLVVILTVLKRAGQFDYSTRSAGDDPSPVTSNCIVNKLLEKLSTFPTMAVHPARFRDADPTLPPSYWTRAFLAQPSPTPSAGLFRRAYRYYRRYLPILSHRSRFQRETRHGRCMVRAIAS